MTQVQHRSRSSGGSSPSIKGTGRSKGAEDLRRADAIMKEIDVLLDRHVAAMDRMLADIDAIRAEHSGRGRPE